MTLTEKLFYKIDESSNQKRISKTKVITCIVFIIFFLFSITMFFTHPNYRNSNIILVLFTSVIYGLMFAVPTYIVGWLIGKLLNRNRTKSYSTTNTDYNSTVTQKENNTKPEKIEKDTANNYAKEFKEAVETDNVDLASDILSKWDKNDANYKYASLIFEGMPPTELSITEMNEIMKTADNMKAQDESLKEWYKSTALEVININKEE